jgi:hypothetical protein
MRDPNWQTRNEQYVETQEPSFQIKTRNDFYDGWLSYILGIDCPTVPLTVTEDFAMGWRVAKETGLYDKTRAVIGAEIYHAHNLSIQLRTR